MSGDVVYGVNAVREALQDAGRINRVLVAKESRAPGCKALVEAAKSMKVAIDFVPQAKLNTLTGSREHQGIMAQISPLEYVELEELLSACPAEATLLVLDRVQHPKNLGMIIRTAVGAGVAGIVLSSRGGALLDDAVVRASAGTVLRVPIATCANLSQALRKMRAAEFWIYGLDAGGDCDAFRMNWPPRVALVAGNESEGIRPGVRKCCDEIVSIPLANELDSLNVAMATGVVLFQVRRG
jgi:23S rRNA (guanosine2251-2'-O)-methyltransferase